MFSTNHNSDADRTPNAPAPCRATTKHPRPTVPENPARQTPFLIVTLAIRNQRKPLKMQGGREF